MSFRFVFVFFFLYFPGNAFPDLVPPSNKVVYDTLGKLIRDRKVRQTFEFILLPGGVF